MTRHGKNGNACSSGSFSSSSQNPEIFPLWFIPVDYLPLIAGLVAITVIVISVVFLFIYSIYYKNTKMRHYSLKNPKLNTQNGNVAHNGWESQFPMARLS